MKNEYTQLIIGYLQGNLSEEETDLFYNWVNENTANKHLFFEIKTMYDAGISIGKPIDINQSWQRLLDKKNKPQSRRFTLWRKIGSYAAVGMLAAAVSSAFFLLSPGQIETGVFTNYIGGDGLEADIVELPDGTQVSLGAKTNFHYDKDYGKSRRVVYLEGEAYFDVASQKDKPFIVKTKEQEIEALGTKFNVMAYPLDSLTVTTLLEGSVRLTTLGIGRQNILRPNQQFIYNCNRKSILLNQVDAQQYTSWTTGYYYFSEQTLESILDRLSHVYGAEFTVQSDALKKRTFTGTFYRGESIKDIMEVINLSVPIKYKINKRHVTISE